MTSSNVHDYVHQTVLRIQSVVQAFVMSV